MEKQRWGLKEIERALVTRLARLTGTTEASPAIDDLLREASKLSPGAAYERDASLADETWTEFHEELYYGAEALRKRDRHKKTHGVLEETGIRLVQARLLFDAALMSHEKILDRENVNRQYKEAADRYSLATDRYNACLDALMTDLSDNAIIDNKEIVSDYETALREVNQAGNAILEARNALEAIRQMSDPQCGVDKALESYRAAAQEYSAARAEHDRSSEQMLYLDQLEHALLLLKRPVDAEEAGYY